MSGCENSKSPRALGLNLCTSDIPCYNGQNLDSVDLPSNPSLNDVIESIDSEICSLIGLIAGAGTPTIPNDPWVELDLPSMVASNYTGTAGGAIGTYNPNLFFTYKVISEDTALVRCNMRLNNVPITGILDFVQFNFTTPNLLASGHNWLPVDKRFTTENIANTVATSSPVSIIAVNGTGVEYVSKGRVNAANNIFAVGFCQPNITNGNYNFEIDFEITCRLMDA